MLTNIHTLGKNFHTFMKNKCVKRVGESQIVTNVVLIIKIIDYPCSGIENIENR